jgi:hypothetical protein
MGAVAERANEFKVQLRCIRPLCHCNFNDLLISVFINLMHENRG